MVCTADFSYVSSRCSRIEEPGLPTRSSPSSAASRSAVLEKPIDADITLAVLGGEAGERHRQVEVQREAARIVVVEIGRAHV